MPQSALRLGVSDYLLKPLKDGELEAAVRHIQGQEEARESKAAKEQDMPVLRLNPVKNTKNKYVEQAVQLIREHFREDINISTVAGELEISEGYLSRVFKKETDYTFTSYLTLYRMKKSHGAAEGLPGEGLRGGGAGGIFRYRLFQRPV